MKALLHCDGIETKKPYTKIQPSHVILGWGKKANTQQAVELSEKQRVPYWHLEDGFISYLGHPALGDKRFALIVDKRGIYYDATCPSDIEDLLNHPDWFSSALKERSSNLLALITENKITKYNHEPVDSWKPEAGEQKRILVVDQTYGDCSVKFGLADDSSFNKMLDAALAENPDSEVWIKIHPDVVLGTKKGYLGSNLPDNPRIRILADKVNAQSLFPYFEKVYVVTSQLGFEALWHRKNVVCFGVPFYSGWGLTDDRVSCPRRKQMHTIESLFAAACLKYTRYIDPETFQQCELEDILGLIPLQRRSRCQPVKTLYAVGFSLWKRAFLKSFTRAISEKIQFVKSVQQAEAKAKSGDGILVWGAKHHNYNPPSNIKLFRAEDAFIRSVGLGADLRRPSSLILDQTGIYFDASRPSDLETAINTIELNDKQLERAKALRKRLKEQRISKYNLQGSEQSLFASARTDQRKILITGQVDSDASIQWGSPEISSNLELIKAVRTYAPDAFIVYKPHPDVLLAGREGHIPESLALNWVDHVVANGDIFDCIEQCDELHVMTSLAGFEALTLGKTVHCWGQPFYAGWGVTVDHLTCNRRYRTRNLEELIYFAHCYYPMYINWQTRRYTTPERVIASIEQERCSTSESGHFINRWLSRKRRKVGYLIEALLS
ncbi:capsular polysaccharide biosynthesis protein [Endozoicomonas sp. 8E]|uniref:capsular polysaccharide biosynthesis protein n=1 Tax=Endozoicomonas sp. 8E TaxID=3035692 RepID=UPI0029392C19|nr:capsular polysaccharide biosynthesis protein [Endozoicomonas sp. 8E]WOG29972.1 capsular polysaccharide biosynthesis protein [Endozoicomonas sp. 8E]